MALRVALRWSKDPEWFYTLSDDTKTAVLAEYRLAKEDPKTTQERHHKIKHDKMQKMIDKHRRLHG